MHVTVLYVAVLCEKWSIQTTLHYLSSRQVESKSEFAPMSPLNPIIYIPPTVLVLAIGGILAYQYQEQLHHFRDRALWRVQRLWSRGAGTGGRYDGIQDPDIHEAVQGWAQGQNPGFGHLEDEDFEFEEEEEEEQHEEQEGTTAVEGQEAEGELMPETLATTTTSARLRMHHEMVQQMRARAGFAPEPFPGDEPAEGEEGEDDEDEDDEEGAAGTSNAHAAGGLRLRKIGKKKAEKLQRKEQMRAYREWMDAQREERRQQEEMFKVHEAALQEERQLKRAAQIEKDRERKEFLKKKEVKDQETKIKQNQIASQKDEAVRKELLAYIQRVKSFRLSELAMRLGRTEAQLLKDLAVIAQETSSPQDQTSSSSASTPPPPRIVLATGVLTSHANSPTLARSKSGGVVPSSSAPFSSPSSSSSSAQLLILRDPSADQYLILNPGQLRAFAEMVQGQGRVSAKELSLASQEIFKSSQKQ